MSVKYTFKKRNELTKDERKQLYEYAMKRSDEISMDIAIDLAQRNREHIDKSLTVEVKRDAIGGVNYNDTERLAFLQHHLDVIYGFDWFDEAAYIADERGHDEPDEQDLLDGFRRMLDKAMNSEIPTDPKKKP